jgi:hypothetical protein
LAFAVGQRQIAIIGNARHWAGFIGCVRGLEPPPIARLVNGDAETQSLFSSGSGPSSHDIAVRTHAY